MQNIGVTSQGVQYNPYRFQGYPGNVPVASTSQGNNNPGVYRSVSNVMLPSNQSQTLQMRMPGGRQMDDAENVKLKDLPFYDVREVLIKPTTLAANIMTLQDKNRNRTRFEAKYAFGLTVGQTALIANSISRDVVTNRIDFGYQIQLRFALLDTQSEQTDNFPPSVVVKVNGKQVQLPPLIPSNYPGVPPRQPSTYLNITDHVKLRPSNLMGRQFPNTIYINWSPDIMNRQWIFSLRLVHKLRSQDLLERMVKKGSYKPEVTHQLINSIMTADEDMALSSLKVSVACPLGKNRMNLPCRASTCSHIQCFDAQLYLQMNEKRPAWKCPVCHKEILYKNLVLDGYFIQVLKELPQSAGNDIEISENGAWRPVEQKAEEPKPSVTSANQKDAVCVDLDDSGLEGSGSNKSKPGVSAQQQPEKPPAEPEIICIDSSDEEMDTSAKPAKPSSSSTAQQQGIRVSFPQKPNQGQPPNHPAPGQQHSQFYVTSGQQAGNSRGATTSLYTSHPLMTSALSSGAAPSASSSAGVQRPSASQYGQSYAPPGPSSSRPPVVDDDDIICLD